MENKQGHLESLSDVYNYYGVRPRSEIQRREGEKDPSPPASAARRMYLESRSSASVEFPYWYTRRWEELEGEIPIIRRAEALKSGFAHLTPAILPGELLAMRKATYLRGSYPMPWLSEAFILAKEDDFYTRKPVRQVK